MPANVKQQIKTLVKAFDTYAVGSKPPPKTEAASAESAKSSATAQSTPAKTSSR